MLDAAVPTESATIISTLPRATRLLLQGRDAAIAAAAAASGVPMSEGVCRSSTSGERAWLWLGPHERLLIAPDCEAATLLRSLGEVLSGIAHSLVDVSHRQLGLEVGGSASDRMLAAGCPLDLDEAAFPVGMCTRTLLGKAEILLWRPAATLWRIEVARSFAPYVMRFLDQARADWAE